MDRYHRQSLLPFVGESGQSKLAAARVLIIGCGALGGTVAEQLCRAGVGSMILVDRDWVEWTNLQRQVLFDEADARDGTPKAVAAARRLSAINSTVTIEPHVTDVDGENLERLAGVGTTPVDLMVDATDNADTRYLLNDVAVKHGISWVYGGCVGVEGRVMAIRPGAGPCLRCVFPAPPVAGELATCDTAGVLGPAASVVASLQATAAMQVLLGAVGPPSLLSIDAWAGRFTTIAVDRDPGCPCCGARKFEVLESVGRGLVSLCGRNAVQVRSSSAGVDLSQLAECLRAGGDVQANRYLLRFRPAGEVDLSLTIFPDARVIVQGTTDLSRARTLVGRYLGV